MILGDLGTAVIKIESAEGDAFRLQGDKVRGLSWSFAGFSRNKRSLVLDLRSEKGQAVPARLLRDADILTENFRPGVLGKMGLTADRLAQINPQLIVVSINGYGSTGPYPIVPPLILSLRRCLALCRPTAHQIPARCAQPRR